MVAVCRLVVDVLVFDGGWLLLGCVLFVVWRVLRVGCCLLFGVCW